MPRTCGMIFSGLAIDVAEEDTGRSVLGVGAWAPNEIYMAASIKLLDA